jgi:hypothetical protein
MVNTKDVLSLSKSASPLLTVYLSTDQAEASNRKSTPAYLAWLRQQAKALTKNLPPAEMEAFEKQLQRVEKVLREKAAKAKGIVIFAGSGQWKIIPAHWKVTNELYWGKPAVSQLLSVVAESKPYCVVSVDHTGARLFRYELGETTELAKKKFDFDPKQWKTRDYGGVAKRPASMPHGPQRDAFRKREAAYFKRMSDQTAALTIAQCKRQKLAFVFLIGPTRLTEEIQHRLPNGMQRNTTLLSQDLAKVPKKDLDRHLVSLIAAWTSQHEKERVDSLLENTVSAVVGFDETLHRLQRGELSTVLVVRGLDDSVRRCGKCGLTSRAADPVCPVCGGPREVTTLREVFPGLLRAHEADIEMVEGEAAAQLQARGGMGGWLRPRRSAAGA